MMGNADCPETEDGRHAWRFFYDVDKNVKVEKCSACSDTRTVPR